MSTVDPISDDVRGAINHSFFFNWSKIFTSNNCATINAVPDPIAILTEIKSVKFVEKKSVNTMPVTKPTYTILLATTLPYALLAKSVIKNAIG